MNDEINDGGPAFPYASEWGYKDGMSLRDWFAGQAIGALLSAALQPDELVGIDFRPNTNEADMAREAYAIADAMLAARRASE